MFRVIGGVNKWNMTQISKKFVSIKLFILLLEPFLQILTDGTGETGDEWVDTHHFAPETNQAAKDIEVNLDEKSTPLQANNDEEDDDAPPMDMDAFMESGDAEDDPFRYVPEKKKESETNDDQDILRTRTYDLHITYDKYYQVGFLCCFYFLYGFSLRFQGYGCSVMMKIGNTSVLNK